MKISKINPSFVIYLLGIVPLAFCYEFLKRSFNDSWWLVGFAVIYLLVLRLAGDFFTRKWRRRRDA